ncbi:MAG: chloride channel protein [Fibrobacterota bacterium]
MKKSSRREDITSYRYLLRWILTALISGTAGAFLVKSFSALISASDTFFSRGNPVFWLSPLAGALIAGFLIYRIEPDAAGEGIPAYIRSMRLHGGRLPFRVTLAKYAASLATLLTRGSGGVAGPLGRINAGLMSSLIHPFSRGSEKFPRERIYTAAICGMAGAMGAIFHASIGGGIFAVEIIERKKMGYSDLFPAILASSTAVFISKSMGWEGFYSFDVPREFMAYRMVGWLVLVALAGGFAGKLYEMTYDRISILFQRNKGISTMKVLTGAFICAVTAQLINPDLLGTSRSVIPLILSGDLAGLSGNLPANLPLAPMLILLLFGKMITNSATVGSGLSAGLTGPSIIVGLLTGALFAHILGVDTESATYYSFLCAGFASILGSCINVPLAAAIMAVEIFGLDYSFAAGLSAVVGFQISRSTTVYDNALHDMKNLR